MSLSLDASVGEVLISLQVDRSQSRSSHFLPFREQDGDLCQSSDLRSSFSFVQAPSLLQSHSLPSAPHLPCFLPRLVSAVGQVQTPLVPIPSRTFLSPFCPAVRLSSPLWTSSPPDPISSAAFLSFTSHLPLLKRRSCPEDWWVMSSDDSTCGRRSCAFAPSCGIMTL